MFFESSFQGNSAGAIESIRNKSPYQSLRMQCLRMRFRVLTLTIMQKDVYSFVWTLLSFVSKTALTNSCVHKPANLHMMPFLMALIYMACLQQIPCFFEEVFWISRGICQSVLLYTSCRCRCWNLLRLVRVNLVISSLIPFFFLSFIYCLTDSGFKTVAPFALYLVSHVCSKQWWNIT